MSKSTTTYTSTTKQTTNFASRAGAITYDESSVTYDSALFMYDGEDPYTRDIATTSYTPLTKQTSTFTGIAKNSTDYTDTSAADVATTLDSSTVTLGSLTVYLQGYTVDPPPSQAGTKNLTTYTAI